MSYPLSHWADVVEGVADQRTPLWHLRLGRPVEYDPTALTALAQIVHRSWMGTDIDVDTDAAVDAALALIEHGIEYIELPWQTEWDTLQIGGSRA